MSDDQRGRRRGRRRRVDERPALALAAVAGVTAVFGGASPTGTAWTDAVVVAVSVGFVAWAAASTRWWMGASLAALAAAFAAVDGDAVLLTLAAAAFAGGLWIGLQRRDVPLARLAVVGIAANVLIRADAGGPLGLTAAIGIGACAVVAVQGVRRRKAAVRRRARLVAGGVAAAAVVAVAGAAVAVFFAQSGLRDGNRDARAGIELLNDGDYAGAADRFAAAAGEFGDADGALGAPWAWPARFVPVVAQHLSAGTGLSSSAAGASADLEAALRVVDPESLRVVDGRIDIASIVAIQQPFRDVQTSIDDLGAAVADADSPWLVEPVTDRLDALAEEIDDNDDRLANAVTAVELAPEVLGADEPRRYFVAFTTPAEARGLGGFMGNWAELTVDQGRIELTAEGRTRDLNLAGDDTRTVSGPADWTEWWGRFGFTNGPGGTTGDVPWSNVTISPEFPSTAQVIAELYPQSDGAALDGVFALDPYVVQALLGFTGPVSIDSFDGQLNERDALDFLLVDQYEIDDTETRIDLLGDVSSAVLDEILTGALPNPTVLARELGPLAAQGRLVGWAAAPGEQALFDDVRLSGALPSLDGGDGLAVVVNNGGANKLDTFLGRDVVYDATVDETTGEVTATAEITLTNDLPDDELADSITGNYTGETEATNRTLFTLYSALTPMSATVDGEDVVLELGTEAGWTTGRLLMAVPPNGSVTLRVELAGTIDVRDGYRLSVRPQPLVVPEQHTVNVVSTDGDALVGHDGVVDEPTTFGAGPTRSGIDDAAGPAE